SGPAKNGSSPPFKAELIYSKMDAARFFGHLEFVNIFLRALNRAGLPLWYSEGFHPKPRVSFGDPLPVGMESEAETVHLLLTRPLAPEEIQAAVNTHLPAGIAIRECRLVSAKAPVQQTTEKVAAYRVVLPGGCLDRKRAGAFAAAAHFDLNRTNRKGKSERIDLCQVVTGLTLVDDCTAELKIRMIPGKRVRPGEVLAAVFDLPEEELGQARIVKQRQPAALLSGRKER
ncbi:MAG: TIGR03936 family radical SAM-associated protein, partial [Desulfosudaceae bacterium]